MKISSIPVKITLKSLPENLRDLSIGSVLKASIKEILGKNSAILDLGSGRIKAEFKDGIPGHKKLNLILTKKANDTLFFKLTDITGRDTYLKKIFEFTITDTGKFENMHQLLAGMIKKGFFTPFELNLSILEFRNLLPRSKRKNATAIFNLLLSRGFSNETLSLISLTFPDTPDAVHLFFRILSFLQSEIFKKFLDYEKSAFNDLLHSASDQFIEDLNSKLNDSEKTDILKDMLSIFTCNNADNKYGELPFWDQEKFNDLKFLVIEDNIILSLELSALGKMNILIKKNKIFDIFFFCEKPGSIDILKQKVSKLREKLNSVTGAGINIIFYTFNEFKEQMTGIFSEMDFENILDIKV